MIDSDLDALHAWLRGDVDVLDDPDGLLVPLAAAFRTCVTGPSPCLATESVRGVADLIAHSFTHVPQRLTEESVRSFDALAIAVNRWRDVPAPVIVPPMVAHVGPEVWAVNRSTGSVSRVLGWMTKIVYFGDVEAGASTLQVPVIISEGSPWAEVEDSDDGESFSLFTDLVCAEDYGGPISADFRKRAVERRRRFQEARGRSE